MTDTAHDANITNPNPNVLFRDTAVLSVSYTACFNQFLGQTKLYCTVDTQWRGINAVLQIIERHLIKRCGSRTTLDGGAYLELQCGEI